MFWQKSDFLGEKSEKSSHAIENGQEAARADQAFAFTPRRLGCVGQAF